MRSNWTTLAALGLLAVSLLIYGCGGGGGGAAAPQAAATFTLSGKTVLNGAGVAGVAVTIANGTTSSTATTDAGGAYQGSLPNGSYTITPSLAGYSFVPASQTITVAGGNVTVPQDFTATATATSFTVSGTVTSGGTALAGVTVTIAGAGSGSATTDAGGNYSFTGVRNGNCTVTPLLNGYTFSPLSRSVTVSNADITVGDFAASAVGSAATYTISGKVTLNGTGLAGVEVTIGGAAVGTLTTDGTGSFTFTGVRNGSYTITPTVSGYLFSPLSQSVVVADGNVTLSDFGAAHVGSITVQF